MVHLAFGAYSLVIDSKNEIACAIPRAIGTDPRARVNRGENGLHEVLEQDAFRRLFEAFPMFRCEMSHVCLITPSYLVLDGPVFVRCLFRSDGGAGFPTLVAQNAVSVDRRRGCPRGVSHRSEEH